MNKEQLKKVIQNKEQVEEKKKQINNMKLIKNMIMFSVLGCFIAGTICGIFTGYEIINGYSPILSLSFMLAFYVLVFANMVMLHNTSR